MTHIQNAIKLAAQAHCYQVDKAGVPTFFHLAYVASRGHNEEERVCGLLHDLMEDTDITAQDLLDAGYSASIVAALELLARREDEVYSDYIERLSHNTLARKVKMVDLEHNMQIARISNPTEEDLERVICYRQALAFLTRVGRKEKFEKELAWMKADKGKGLSEIDECVLRYQLCLYEDFCLFASVLEKILLNICSVHAPYGIVQSRAKSPESFREKCLRDGKSYNDPLHQISDLCGARVIVTSKEELETVCQVIEDLFEGEIKEDVGGARLGFNQFGYASIHFDNIMVDRPTMMGVDTRMEFTEGLRGEIQLRTLAQHQYSVFSHDRVYKGGSLLDDIQKRKLSRMAAALEELDEDFDELIKAIKDEGGS
jgi:ppGpp synthetase/RelA/SpoT-type nucleotidyltranferase